LTTSVTAAQVQIWNNGSESIRPEHVLQEITLVTNPRVPILEATIRRTKRAVSGIALDDSHINDGRLGIRWRILEHGDGAVLQVVYAGRSDNALNIEGFIEGQPYVLTEMPSTTEPVQSTPDPMSVLVPLTLFAILGSAALAARTWLPRRLPGVTRTLPLDKLWVAFTGQTIALAGVWLWLAITTRTPPFGF
jgi:hypothetical protein